MTDKEIKFIGLTELRQSLGETLGPVEKNRHQVALTRHNKIVAVVISPQDYRRMVRLEALVKSQERPKRKYNPAVKGSEAAQDRRERANG